MSKQGYLSTYAYVKMNTMIVHPAWESFIMTFVPLFVVIDAVGTLPFVVSLGSRMLPRERKVMNGKATITAALVGLFFLFLGRFILNLMGITIGSFAIGGGIILLVLAITLMISTKTSEETPEEQKGGMAGVVPIGTPLTSGPATIATLLLLATQFDLYWVLISFAVNIVLVWIIFSMSSVVIKILGKGGILAISKVSNLILAAIAVNMIFKGFNMLGILNVPV
jgi:multiple antibiotic resistance protein